MVKGTHKAQTNGATGGIIISHFFNFFISLSNVIIRPKRKQETPIMVCKAPSVALPASAKQVSTFLSLQYVLTVHVFKLTPLLIGGVPTLPEVDFVVATLGRLDPAPAPPIEVLFVPPPEAVEETVEFRLR